MVWTVTKAMPTSRYTAGCQRRHRPSGTSRVPGGARLVRGGEAGGRTVGKNLEDDPDVRTIMRSPVPQAPRPVCGHRARGIGGRMVAADARPQDPGRRLPRPAGRLGVRLAPWWWPLPVLLVAGILTALTITRLPGHGGAVPTDGLSVGITLPRAVPGVDLAALATLGLGLSSPVFRPAPPSRRWWEQAWWPSSACPRGGRHRPAPRSGRRPCRHAAGRRRHRREPPGRHRAEVSLRRRRSCAATASRTTPTAVAGRT